MNFDFKKNKTIIVAVVAGMLGGLVTFGGASLIQNGINSSNVEVPVGSNAGGTTSTSNLKVNVSEQAPVAFDKVKGAVVSVINLQKATNNSPDGIISSIFGQQEQPATKNGKLEEASEGSGVIYKKSGNSAYIVTNNHVVKDSNSLEIIMSDGKKMPAKIVGTDAITDLAVLKINASAVNTVASFGDSENIKVGETALAIGSPLGSQYATSLTEGIISAKKRTVQTGGENGQSVGDANVIQTDAAINSGNSGGPLINLAGQVIGINSMKLSSNGGGDNATVEGMGFAIPANEVVKVVNQLVAKGKITRPALGVELVDVTDVPASQQQSVLNLPTSVTDGAVVMKSKDNSPAQKAGLEQYDVITKVDNKKIKNTAELQEELFKHKLNDKIHLSYYHNGKAKTVTVKLTQASSR